MPKLKALKRFLGRKEKPEKAKPSIKLVNITVAESIKRRKNKKSIKLGKIGPMLAARTTPTIVCDLGSAWTRIGFADRHSPTVETPSWVVRLPAVTRSGKDKYFALDDEAKKIRDMSRVIKPVKNGHIVDVDALTVMLDDGFRSIGALTARAEDLSGRNLLLAFRPSAPQKTHVRLFQTLMETYRLDGCHFTFQQPLALFACGRLNGLVGDSGQGVTQAVPVYRGQVVRGTTETVNLGGEDVTDALASCLAERWDYRAWFSWERDAVDELKERLTLLSLQSGRAPTDAAVEAFRLPDERDVTLGAERYMCAEPLFNPQIINRKGVGVGTAVTLALRSLPSEERKEIAKNIFPLGGNSLLKGFDQRLQAELERKYGGNAVVRRLSSSVRQSAAWQGGAALANTEPFADIVVTRAEYQEEGMRAYLRKCFAQISL